MRKGWILLTLLTAVLLLGPNQAQALSLAAVIDVAQATTAQPGASGSGFAMLTLDEATRVLTWHIEYSGLAGTENNAHFHGPAEPGMTAGVRLGLSGPGGTSPKDGSLMLSVRDAAEVASGLWYINIHSTNSPGGEIRGQVLPVQTPEPTALVLLALAGGALILRRP